MAPGTALATEGQTEAKAVKLAKVAVVYFQKVAISVFLQHKSTLSGLMVYLHGLLRAYMPSRRNVKQQKHCKNIPT